MVAELKDNFERTADEAVNLHQLEVMLSESNTQFFHI